MQEQAITRAIIVVQAGMTPSAKQVLYSNDFNYVLERAGLLFSYGGAVSF